MGSKAIALSYCSDGFNPFHHIITQGTYSIWAQTGLILNLPAHMRVKTGTTLLLGLISGNFIYFLYTHLWDDYGILLSFYLSILNFSLGFGVLNFIPKKGGFSCFLTRRSLTFGGF